MVKRGAKLLIAASVGAGIACGAPPKPPAAPVLTVTDKCPDLGKADDLAAFDFAKTYALSADAGEKLKAAMLTALELLLLADKVDADAGIACAQIAHELGDKGDWRSGSDACTAAAKAVQDARAKLGAKAQLKLVVRTPICLVDASLVTKCASLCDSSVGAGKVRAECLQSAGRCDGNCEGVCEPKVAMKCEGTCHGLCEGAIKGTCAGRCVGTCDGRPSKGGCLGTCVGTCDKAAINGECKGQCTGSCDLTKAGICDGVCGGSCSVELADARCAGEFKPPEVSSDCRARCDVAVINKTECGKPHAGVALTGTRDRETGDALRAAVDHAYPALLKMLFEVGAQAPKRLANAQAVIEGARAAFKDMAKSGSAATAAASEKQLVKCFDEELKKATVASQAARNAIERALAVREEASKQ